jgi:S-layer homology domain
MVNLPPESEERRRDRGVPSAPLSFDECVAVGVAFLAIGGILLWGMTRGGGWQSAALLGGQPLLEALTQEPEASEPGPEAPEVSRDRSQPTDPRGAALLPLPSPSAAEPGLVDGNVRRAAADEAPAAAGDTAPSTSDPSASALPPLDISDVPQTHWAYPFISGLYEAGFLPDFPEGKFEPDKPMTRAELAALLNTSLFKDASAPPPQSFIDLPANYWAKGAIDQVVGAGYMRGFPEGDFRPDQLVPREQVLVTLTSGTGLAPSSFDDEVLSRFTDSSGIADWARSKVAAATAAGLVVNYPEQSQLRPTAPATRAEVVAIMYQALAAQGVVTPVASPYSVPGLQ